MNNTPLLQSEIIEYNVAVVTRTPAWEHALECDSLLWHFAVLDAGGPPG